MELVSRIKACFLEGPAGHIRRFPVWPSTDYRQFVIYICWPWYIQTKYLQKAEKKEWKFFCRRGFLIIMWVQVMINWYRGRGAEESRGGQARVGSACRCWGWPSFHCSGISEFLRPRYWLIMTAPLAYYKVLLESSHGTIVPRKKALGGHRRNVYILLASLGKNRLSLLIACIIYPCIQNQVDQRGNQTDVTPVWRDYVFFPCNKWTNPLGKSVLFRSLWSFIVCQSWFSADLTLPVVCFMCRMLCVCIYLNRTLDWY